MDDAVKASVTGPDATSGVLPKGSAMVALGVVTKVAGNTNVAAALPPTGWALRPCRATTVRADAPVGSAARTRFKASPLAAPL